MLVISISLGQMNWIMKEQTLCCWCWKDTKRSQDLLMALKITCEIHTANNSYKFVCMVHLQQLMTSHEHRSYFFISSYFIHTTLHRLPSTIDYRLSTHLCMNLLHFHFDFGISTIKFPWWSFGIRYGNTFDPLVCAHRDTAYCINLNHPHFSFRIRKGVCRIWNENSAKFSI